MKRSTSPKGDSYYSRRARNYTIRRSKQAWWPVEQEEMKNLLETLPKGLKVLDMPFGTGRFAEFYAERGFDIHGLDISVDMLATAAAELGDLYKQCTCKTGDARQLPYEDEEFDLVVSCRFLSDIIIFGDAKIAIKELHRVTKKHAILQLSENPKEHIEPADSEIMGNLMARENVEALLLSLGFKLIERRLVRTSDVAGEIYHMLFEKVDDAG